MTRVECVSPRVGRVQRASERMPYHHFHRTDTGVCPYKKGEPPCSPCFSDLKFNDTKLRCTFHLKIFHEFYECVSQANISSLR